MTNPTTFVPDSITPVEGWRVWDFAITRKPVLSSVAPVSWGIEWPQDAPLRAVCHCYPNSDERYITPHQAPHVDCTCGIYLSKDEDSIREQFQFDIEACLFSGNQSIARVYGQAKGWGLVQEHEEGWRVQYARPSKLFVPVNFLAWIETEGLDRLERVNSARASELLHELYGCDTLLDAESVRVALERRQEKLREYNEAMSTNDPLEIMKYLMDKGAGTMIAASQAPQITVVLADDNGVSLVDRLREKVESAEAQLDDSRAN